jgi:hypothetical protein
MELMELQDRKFEVRLWREDLFGFYRYFLKTVVLDLDGFERDLDTFENDSTISLRKFRTATLIGISLVREQIFDKRWMIERLLGPACRGYFSDRERMNLFLDTIISTPEAREHVKRANKYLNSNVDWKIPAVQSVEGQKSIRVAMMRSAVRTHNVSKSFVPYYGRGISVVW